LVRFSFYNSFFFLLKKKLEGGISSGEIGVRSPTKMSLELVFPKLVYKGVNDVIGEIIVVECSCPIIFGVLAEVDGFE
jgi:hypothetical protein